MRGDRTPWLHAAWRPSAAHIAPGAVVIDVGNNRIADPSRPSGERLVGDVDETARAAW
ncbi:MAG: hypothetical protein IPH86_07320 [bacterium]|nr:hypothetical protein [bacterium]